jgi:hypothetical protein
MPLLVHKALQPSGNYCAWWVPVLFDAQGDRIFCRVKNSANLMAADRNQWRAICGSKMPSTTEETPTSPRQDIWAQLRNGNVPLWVEKLTRKTQMSGQDEQREREKIHTVRPAGLKTRRSFSYTKITKNSCFWLYCCFLHNAKCIIGD